MLEYMIEDLPEYKSRGERIMSVLNGSGSVDVLPGRPDVQASDSENSLSEHPGRIAGVPRLFLRLRPSTAHHFLRIASAFGCFYQRLVSP